MQKEQAAGIAAQRRAPTGLAAFLSRITGIQVIADYRQRKKDYQRAQEYRQQRSALARRHRSELKDFAHHDHALTSVEKREARSLRTELRREQFRAIAGPAREQIAQKDRALKEAARKENARDITAPPPVKQPARTKDSLADKFRKLVGRPKPTPEQIRENAADMTNRRSKNRSTQKTASPEIQKAAEPPQKNPIPQAIRENAASITKPPPPPAPVKQPEPDRQSLKDAFARRAAQKRRDDDRSKGSSDRDKHYRRPAPDPLRFPRQ